MAMTTGSVVQMAKAAMVDAASLRSRVSSLAAEADDVLLGRVLRSTDDLVGDLDLLAGIKAQIAVGPTVNVASEAVRLLRPPLAAAPMPIPSSSTLESVERLLGDYVRMAEGWAARG